MGNINPNRERSDRVCFGYRHRWRDSGLGFGTRLRDFKDGQDWGNINPSRERSDRVTFANHKKQKKTQRKVRGGAENGDIVIWLSEKLQECQTLKVIIIHQKTVQVKL